MPFSSAPDPSFRDRLRSIDQYMTQYLSPDGSANTAPPSPPHPSPPHPWINERGIHERGIHERTRTNGTGAPSVTELSTDAIDAGDYEPFPPVRRDHLSRYHKSATPWPARSSANSAVSVDNHDLLPQPLPPSRPVPVETAAEEDGLAMRLDEAWGRFETQVELINRLGQDQESAIVELRAIAREVSALWQAIAPEENRSTTHLLAIAADHRGLSHIQPDAQGTWWLTLRPIDWQQIDGQLISRQQMNWQQIEGQQINGQPSNCPDGSGTERQRRIAQQHFFPGDRPWAELPRPPMSPRTPLREMPTPLHWTASASQPVPSPIRRSPQARHFASPRPAIAPPSEQPRTPDAEDRGWGQRIGEGLSSRVPPLVRGLARGMGQVLGWVRQEGNGTAHPPLQPRSRLHRSSRRSRHAQTQPDSLLLPEFSLKGAALWICGAAVARAMINLLRVSLPGWQPLWLLLLLLPAAIAIYQVRQSPASGFVAAYRLLLILVGLLIGGRL